MKLLLDKKIPIHFYRYILLFLFFYLNINTVFNQAVSIDPPVLKTVSVKLFTDSVIITWDHSSFSNVKEYVIYLFDEYAAEIDRVNSNITRYSHYNQAVNAKPQSYAVAAVPEEGIGNYTISPYTTPKSTVHLSIELDTCNNYTLMNWTSYDGCEDGVYTYEIFYKVNNNTMGLDLLVPEYPNLSDTSHYLDFKSGVKFYFWIRANCYDGTSYSRSNVVFKKIVLPARPDTIYPKSLSVDSNSFIINYSVYPDTAVADYKLNKYKESKFIETINITNTSNNSITYTDTDVDVTKCYKYSVSAYSCDSIEIEDINT